MVGHVQLPVFGTDNAPATLLGSCGRNPGLACQLVWDVSHDSRAATLTSEFLAGPVHLLLRVLFVVLLAFFIQALVHRLINRLTERATLSFLPQLRNGMTGAFRAPGRVARRRLVQRGVSRRRVRPRRSESDDSVADEAAAARAAAAAGIPADLAGATTTAGATASATAGGAAGATAGAAASGAASAQAAAGQPAIDDQAIDDGPVIDGPVIDGPAIDGATAQSEAALVDERRKQRVRALGAILRSAASVTIFSIAGLAVLGDLGINLAPLLASAGVVGVAVGFGAQNLVRDYLSGIFMLVEDQYGVGDVITVGTATGTVENVTLRITRLRDVNGIVWHIRNGAIETLGNETQGWARAVIDFPVPYEADLVTIRNLLQETGDEMWDEPSWRAVMLEAPEVWGAQKISGAEVIMRIAVKTAPLRQWEVEREMRARVKTALHAAGIPPVPAAD